MRTTITYSEKHIIIHILRGDLLKLKEIVSLFSIFWMFPFDEKWHISKLKIVDWYLDFSKVSYTTLKSVISSFKIGFQNYGQLKRKFLRPKKYK